MKNEHILDRVFRYIRETSELAQDEIEAGLFLIATFKDVADIKVSVSAILAGMRQQQQTLREIVITMEKTKADLDAEIQTLTEDEATVESIVTTVLEDLVAQKDKPAIDLTDSIDKLAILDNALKNFATKAQTDDTPVTPDPTPVPVVDQPVETVPVVEEPTPETPA